MNRILYCLFLWIFSSCTRPSPPMHSAWVIDESLPAKEEEAISEWLGFSQGGLTTASFLDLQPDGNYHSNLFDYDYGKWNYQGHILTLSGHLHPPVFLFVNKLTDEQLIVTDYKQNAWYCFRGYSNRFALPADNPFAVENNFWRMPARQKESDKEIARRLYNHFQFWEKYFSWGNTARVKPLNIGAVPSPLQMYGNGFELTNYYYEPLSWVKLFYDTADCYKAYEKLYYLFAAKDIKWPKDKGRFESMVSAFQQLQGWVEEKKSKK